MNLYETFRTRPGWNSAHLFLRDLDTAREFNYGELDAATARIANRLTHRYAVKPGDRVAVQVEKSPEAFFFYLACLRVGAVYLPLNPAYQPAEIEYFIADAEPVLFVNDLAEVIGEIERESDVFKTVPREDQDLATILYTSGTTGRSKGAMITHGNLGSNARALSSVWGFTESDRLLHALPIFHVHGLFISLHCALASGSSVFWLKKFDPDEVIQHLPSSTVFMGVPTFYTRLLERKDLSADVCRGIRLFVSGSAPLRRETFEAFESRTGHRILERYGMTETGIITSNALNGKRVPGAVGAALPEVEVRVASGGMIEVRGPNVFAGYWRQPDKTRQEFREDGFFKTGDLGEWGADGYLRINGRDKDLIISGGFNVYPKEIELILDAIPGVEESAVFGVPHPDFGECVVAAVIRSGGEAGARIEEASLISWVRTQVAAFKAPKRIVFIESLPKNAMEKFKKTAFVSATDRYFRLSWIHETADLDPSALPGLLPCGCETRLHRWNGDSRCRRKIQRGSPRSNTGNWGKSENRRRFGGDSRAGRRLPSEDECGFGVDPRSGRCSRKPECLPSKRRSLFRCRQAKGEAFFNSYGFGHDGCSRHAIFHFVRKWTGRVDVRGRRRGRR